MPKTLILHAPAAAALARELAEGARSVRFAEVDLRPLAAGDEAAALAHDDVAQYDAIVLDATVADGADQLGRAGLLPDRVGASFGGDAEARWTALRRMGEAGMLLVPPAGAADALRALGQRVATVAEWVRHAKSHHHH
jgi:hypothetical protein